MWHLGKTDEEQLKQMLESHDKWTGSKRARELLEDWSTAFKKFVKVFPNEYKRALSEMAPKPEQASTLPTQPASKTKKSVAAK